MTESLVLEINEKVKRQYETYPYPDYSLFIPLRTQEAYASHSLFAAQLLAEKGRSPAQRSKAAATTLIAGSGDVLPYVVSFWEAVSTRIHAIDLSERNIQRARLRSTFRPQTFTWQTANLEARDFALPKNIDHIDSYGVLHHLAEPFEVVRRLADSLEAGGTARFMVYNSSARLWIHELQASFRLLGLSAYDRSDLDRALNILKVLMRVSPRYRDRLQPMQSGIFYHSARFVDTFFHAHEGRQTLTDWLKAFSDAGLEAIGLFDRYAELDDLPNPLLAMPDHAALEARTSDRRFENNFEFYLAKGDAASTSEQGLKLPTRWIFRVPPKAWFSYSETNDIPLSLRFRLWKAFVKTMKTGKGATLDGLEKKLRPEALQRLARIGAIFPSQFSSPKLRDLLLAPIHASMETPELAPSVDLSKQGELQDLLRKTAQEKGMSASVVERVLERLEAGQRD